MDAEIITYDTKSMTKSNRSIVSKRLFGFKDRTKKSKYVYQRTGVLDTFPHIKITKKTFVVGATAAEKIKKIIHGLGGDVKSWKIEISEI